jgi:hypothetical protein
MKELPPTIVQRVCAIIDDRDLALALMDCGEELTALTKNISAARLERLQEDLKFVKNQLENGALQFSLAVTAKEKIQTAIDKATEPEEPSSQQTRDNLQDRKPSGIATRKVSR